MITLVVQHVVTVHGCPMMENPRTIIMWHFKDGASRNTNQFQLVFFSLGAQSKGSAAAYQSSV